MEKITVYITVKGGAAHVEGKDVGEPIYGQKQNPVVEVVIIDEDTEQAGRYEARQLSLNQLKDLLS